MPRSWSLLVSGAAALGVAACGGAGVPDPRPVVQEYERAVRAGDAEAVYALLSAEGRAAYGRPGTKRLLSENQAELLALAHAAAGPGAKAVSEARVRFVDGEATVVRVEGGAFRISSAGGFPSSASTPAAALGDLRAAIARRSYAALLLVLSRDTRAAMEKDLGAIAKGLDHPEVLDVRVRRDKAEVTLPGGHRVLLQREDGAWKIHDFE